MKTLVLLATKQNWPNALSFFYYKGIGLDRVVIYATDKMGGSATALKGLIDKHKFPCIIHPAAGNSANEFREFAQGLEGDLVFNMTGGLKRFWLAIPSLLERGAECIYRDIDEEKWFRITPDAEEPFDDLSQTERMDEDGLPVVISLQLQEAQFVVKKDQEKYADHPIGNLIGLWNDNTDRDAGTRFEELTIKVFRECGLKATKILVTTGDVRVMDTDIFALTRSKPAVIECKLVNGKNTSAIDIISKLATKSRNLGGLNARTVLCLPNWELGEGPRALAEHEGIEIWGPNETRTLFSRIYELSGSDNPDLLGRCQQWDEALCQQLDTNDEAEEFMADTPAPSMIPRVFDYSSSVRKLREVLSTDHASVGGAILIPSGRLSLILDHLDSFRGGLSLGDKMKDYLNHIGVGQPAAALLDRHYIICVPWKYCDQTLKFHAGRGKDNRILCGRCEDLVRREQWHKDKEYSDLCKSALEPKLKSCLAGVS